MVAQVGGARCALLCVEPGDERGKLRHGIRREVVVMRHRVEFAGPRRAAEQLTHHVFGDARVARDIAHARRRKGLGVEQRFQHSK